MERFAGEGCGAVGEDEGWTEERQSPALLFISSPFCYNLSMADDTKYRQRGYKDSERRDEAVKGAEGKGREWADTGRGSSL